MNSKLLFISLLFCRSILLSQNTGDCSGAINICTNASFQVTPNGFGGIDELNGNISNPTTNPASGNSGCLLSGELNSTWMIINIASPGTLEFSFGQDNGIGCLDWIMWPYGPNACTDIFNNTLAPVRCNWNGMCEFYSGVGTPPPAGGDPSNFEPELIVAAGEQYVVCLSNYSSQSTTVPLNFFGTATVSCNTVIPITVNGGTICPGDSITLTASGATSYVWSPGNQTTASITVSPAVSTTYTVDGTNATGSGIGTSTVTVLSPNDPLCGCTVTASNSSPVCSGETFDLSATTINGGTYDWTGPNGYIANGQNITGISSLAPGTHTFNLTVTDANGNICISSTDVTINPNPPVSAGPDVSICLNDSHTFNGSGANTYTWSGGIQDGQSFVVSNSLNYTLTGTDLNGCQNSDDVMLNVVFANLPVINPDVTLGCIPLTVTFDNQTVDAQNCQWSFGNNQSASGCGSQVTTYDSEGCFDVTLMVENSMGCDTTVTFPNVVCTESAIASFYASPSLIGSGNQTVSFYNLSENAVSYYWDFGDGSSGSTEYEPIHDYPVSQSQSFLPTLIAYTASGCSDTATFIIDFEEQLIFYVPNAFTPDEDQFNQDFKPVFNSGYDVMTFHMQIFNRWGELIWESFDPNVGWSGSYGLNGAKVQEGTYTWKISFNPKYSPERVTTTGSIHLLR